MLNFLSSWPSRIVTLILMLAITAFYAFPKTEIVPEARPLAAFPAQVGDWVMTRETELDEEIKAVLKADDTLLRDYSGPTGVANLYVAFFRSQSTGVAPHSPKNCLPGSGWVPSESGIHRFAIPGRAEPIEVQRYVVAKGESRSLVMYWYQSSHRIVASEYWAKFYTVVDSIRHRRSDASLVRVVVGVGPGGIQEAERTALAFIHSFFGPLSEYLPH